MLDAADWCAQTILERLQPSGGMPPLITADRVAIVLSHVGINDESPAGIDSDRRFFRDRDRVITLPDADERS